MYPSVSSAKQPRLHFELTFYIELKHILNPFCVSALRLKRVDVSCSEKQSILRYGWDSTMSRCFLLCVLTSPILKIGKLHILNFFLQFFPLLYIHHLFAW